MVNICFVIIIKKYKVIKVAMNVVTVQNVPLRCTAVELKALEFGKTQIKYEYLKMVNEELITLLLIL